MEEEHELISQRIERLEGKNIKEPHSAPSWQSTCRTSRAALQPSQSVFRD